MAKTAPKPLTFGTGRRPDYNVSALNRQTEHKGRVGAAWVNADGSISIKLNPFVVLMADGDLALTLFPADESPKTKTAKPPEEDQTDDELPKEPGVIPF